MSSVESAQLLYYAYGSNLHPARIGARIPSSQLLGVAEVSGYDLCFHKRGADQSAKCNALYTGDSDHKLLGALFSMASSEKPILDDIEGPGYVVTEIVVNHAGQQREAFMYVAEAEYIDDSLAPYQWYKDYVCLGARFLQFPESYLSRLTSVEAVSDVNDERHARNEQILKLMR